jgi:hypothetical protein
MNPLDQPWLLAKIIGLLAYIGLGTVALKRGKTKAIADQGADCRAGHVRLHHGGGDHQASHSRNDMRTP